MDKGLVKDSSVYFQTSSGVEIRATVLRLTRHLAVFEVYAVGNGLRTSEVLNEFKITLQDRAVYSGKAVIKSLVDTGLVLVCEATLEDSWIDLDFSLSGDTLRAEFAARMEEWQKFYKVIPEYKVLAADMQNLLTEIRLWLEQVELGIRSSPSEDRSQLERRIADDLSEAAFPLLDALFGKFESLAAGIDKDLQAAHSTYIRRQMHPLLLCSPFAFRTVHKPLGYAGDYEVVNMILRDPHEGGSLYAKILNRWFIKQPPAEAHRNRVTYLTEKLIEETARLALDRRPTRIFNLGCGPAKEVQSFMIQHALSDRAQFTLIDFNEETLAHASTVLEELKRKHGRNTTFQFLRKSVVQILKAKSRSTDGAVESKYDFVYCAGLFDYLPGPVCKQLMTIFYDMLAPGGLLLSTNVDASNPIRFWLGDILDWHLIYRTSRQMMALCPDRIDPNTASVKADLTGVNLYLEIRKPAE